MQRGTVVNAVLVGAAIAMLAGGCASGGVVRPDGDSRSWSIVDEAGRELRRECVSDVNRRCHEDNQGEAAVTACLSRGVGACEERYLRSHDALRSNNGRLSRIDQSRLFAFAVTAN